MAARAGGVGLVILAIGICLPAMAAAQGIRIEGRAVSALTRPWRSLDFGKPKAPPVARQDQSRAAEPMLPHHGVHAVSDSPLWHSIAPTSHPEMCAAEIRAAHSGPGWFAPSLPPLPEVQSVQPGLLGHHARQALPETPAAPSCRGR